MPRDRGFFLGIVLAMQESEKALALKESERALAMKESEMALAMKEFEKQLAMKEAEMRRENEGQTALLQYRYAAISSRFWLEKLFSDIGSFAEEKKWTSMESIHDTRLG